MVLKLTDEQQRQVQSPADQPTQVIDPRTHRRYVLLPLEEYDLLQEDQQDQSHLRTASARTLGRRLAEDQ